MVGYPHDLRDKSHNLPICRRGITASHPEVDFCGKPELLIDIPCAPGVSGSPVFVLDAKGYTDEQGNIRCGEPHNLLLGVATAAAAIGSDDQVTALPESRATHAREQFCISPDVRCQIPENCYDSGEVLPLRPPGSIDLTRPTGEESMRAE